MATTYHVSPRHDQKRFCWAFHLEDQRLSRVQDKHLQRKQIYFCKFPKTPSGKAHRLICEMILTIL